ncbi:monovalent cation/H(+) antiporter subunit G [Oceanobacillus profundus]|uniref:Na+/H+ antiporter subunit G n=1 Tax=Oceanobacillus profundus TaxID=372463 RepID=A0A417YJD1_9BACI|nr:monovalent cation/H(+) antiporter subunit G [Oceanobacillus profundus]MBR3120218.1 Na+/H+ antiporter subunit G [Oceanobacillus sp.]PAE31101.1 Na+/H+ antiporter subunit G1 [Paenibacillus sp. 7884-2]MCM3396899.1 monovalent cation/H(+) antiporter subunit G [Oceanobacillus profundus]MDO6448199.1 monovalent cation/H(+) antiporter subunit G [Oceanobacillus profundus]RHW33111.1 Na+/H+ antiporter subunit G [Oceanobacillus profundus]
MTVIEIITSIFILIGTFFTILSAIGVIRLPDVYSRMHAAGKSSTLGVVTLMLATFIYFIPTGIINGKVLLAILFLFITAPLSALMVNRSAYYNGVPLAKNSIQDDLRKKFEQDKE